MQNKTNIQYKNLTSGHLPSSSTWPSSMAPPNWATDEQLLFLRSYAPMFVEYTAKENQSKFWPRLSEDWFSRWPELNVLIKNGQLPPQAGAANVDTPDDADTLHGRYRLTEEERELYGTAIRTRKQVSMLQLGEYATHQRDSFLEIAKLDA